METTLPVLSGCRWELVLGSTGIGQHWYSLTPGTYQISKKQDGRFELEKSLSICKIRIIYFKDFKIEICPML
jgi:hypothetical protein